MSVMPAMPHGTNQLFIASDPPFFASPIPHRQMFAYV